MPEKFLLILLFILPFLSQNILGQNSSRDFFNLGEKSFDKGNYALAVEYYTRALKINSRFPEALISRGVACERLKDYDKALLDYQESLIFRDDIAIVYNNIGWLKFLKGENEDALKNLNKAIALDDSLSIAYNNRGLVNRKLENLKKALEDYRKAINLNPYFVDAYDNMGDIRYSLQQYQSALQNYSKAIDIDSTFISAYNNRGLTLHEIKEYAAAVKDFDRALEIDSTLVLLYINKSNSYLKLLNYGEVIKVCDQAINIDSSEIDVWLNRAYALLKLNQFRESEENLKKSKVLNGNYAKVYYYLGLLHMQKNETEAAILNFDKAMKLDRYLEGLKEELEAARKIAEKEKD